MRRRAVILLCATLAASGCSRALASLLFGVTSGDLTTFVAAAVAVLLVACCASALPAWRAAGVDPNVALRCRC